MAAQIAARIVGVSKHKSSTTLSASYATASITPVSGELMLVWVASTFATAPNTPTLAGTGGLSVTWTAVANILNSGNTQKLTLFRGVPSSGTAGVLTVAFAGQVQLTVTVVAVSYPSVNQASVQGVVQSVTGTANTATSKSLTLAAGVGNNTNIVVYGSYSNQNTTWTAGSGSTAVDAQADAQGTLGVEGTSPATLPPNQVPDATFGASGTVNAIAAEIKALYALDIRPMADGLKPGTGTAAIAQSGARRFRGVFSTGGEFGGRRSHGRAGVGGYPAADPTGRAFGSWASQRDDAVGNPTPPSQRQTGQGVLRGIVLPGAVGINTWTIDVKFESGKTPFPRVIAKADPALGFFADVVVSASAPGSVDGGTDGFRLGGYAWQTLTVVFTLIVAGPVELWREKQRDGMDLIWWDNLVPVITA